MKALYYSLLMWFKQISRDSMVAMLCLAPLLVAMLFYWGLPALNDWLTNAHGFMGLQAYHRLFDLLLTLLAPYLFGFASVLILLGERDEHIIPSLYASPLGRRGYLVSRIVFPTLLSIWVTVLTISVFHLSDLGIGLLITLSVLAAVVCLIPFLLIVTYARNKVEGLALAKMSGLILAGLFVPFFITGRVQYIFAFLPSFWLAKLALSSNLLHALATVITSLVWLRILYARFCRKKSIGL